MPSRKNSVIHVDVVIFLADDVEVSLAVSAGGECTVAWAGSRGDTEVGVIIRTRVLVEPDSPDDIMTEVQYEGKLT